MALRRALVLATLILAACGPYPRDIGGTLDRIEREHRMHVGFGALGSRDQARAREFVARLEEAAGADAEIDTAPLESQIGRLEDGELDLLIGEFREDTPWRSEVAVIEPIARRTVGKRILGLSPAAANGENRWIALVEREVRDGRRAR